MNHCAACNAKLGDSFFHRSSGGAFSPRNAQEAAHIILQPLAVSGSAEVSGAFARRDLIYTYAKRPQS